MYVEGVQVILENSHPQYVKAALDIYNQTLSLFALKIGEANIKVKYSNDTFDVIRVKVVSSIKPVSPVHAHVGASIKFVYDEATPNAKWESSNSQVLTVDTHGHAKAEDIGASVVSYKGDVMLQSTVYVSKVQIIELDNRPEYITNVKTNSHYKEEYSIPLKLYLTDSIEELTPDVYIDGDLLIQQNVKVECEVDYSDFVSAYPHRINNRFFCLLRPKSNAAPPSVLTLSITVSTDAYNSYKITRRFEIPVMSQFKVLNPSTHQTLYSDQRSIIFEVSSNSDFTVQTNQNLLRTSKY